MKKSPSFILLTVAVLASYVLSACGAVSAGPAASANQSSQAGPKMQEVVVAFTGPVESMKGNQWIVDGQTVTVEPSSLPDANIQVGDLVKVEGKVGPDGAITTTHVANPMAFNGFAPASSDGYPNPTETPGPDDQKVSGVIEAITDTSVTIDGVTYLLTNMSEVDGLLAVGDMVKIEFVTNPDGSMTILEIERTSHSGNDNGNENGNVNSNGNGNDNGNENVNSNGNGNENVNSNDDNENDDDDSNSNENENDDDSDNGNSNGNSNNANNGQGNGKGNGHGNGNGG